MMGTSQNGKKFYQVKIKGLNVTSLKELGRLMGPLQRQAFRKVYGKILDLTTAEVFTEVVVSLAQYYDQQLRCFTIEDFQIVPIVEEFEEILGCPLGGRKLSPFSLVKEFKTTQSKNSFDSSFSLKQNIQRTNHLRTLS